MKKLSLSEIWIYPIKSLGGIQLSSAKVMQKGLQYDRRFMLVDDEDTCMTQRVYPKMALFKISIQADQFVIQYSSHSIILPLIPSTSEEGKLVKIWDDTVVADEMNALCNQWFSDHLEIKCKLVYFPEENQRPVEAAFKINNEHVSLADAYPFLIIGQSSLDDLNARLEEPLPMNRFRPNLVFTGGQPYEEDTWSAFTIGQNKFIGVKPCARCVLPNVNQDTAAKGIEPLKTLATYRKQNNKVLFGQNLVAIDNHYISVGDDIQL